MDSKAKQIAKMILDGASYRKMRNELHTSTEKIKKTKDKLKENLGDIDLELIIENVRLAKNIQAFQDKNRIEKKGFREYVRLENAIKEIGNELVKVLDKHSLPKRAFRTKKIKKSEECAGLLQITDTHFNELVDLPFNHFDFPKASQRIKKYIQDATLYFKAKGVTNVCVAITGDLINSDRRLDEKLSQATNRAKALFLSISILEQALLDLQQNFNLSVATVIGNESRIQEEIGWVVDVASDNYDYIIHHSLKKLFAKSDVKFYMGGEKGVIGSPTEQVVELNRQNVLLLHGNQIKRNNRENAIQSIVGKWSRNGIKVDFVISGHDHCTRIGDSDARSSSLVGGNAYSNDALQLYSRASQNIHLFYKNGNRDSIKIDLQNCNNEGYPIEKELESYNAKSLKKSKQKTTILKVVV